MSELIATHRRLLEARRHALNLVGPGPLEDHYRDSAQAVGWLDPRGHWVDLGTGAGFPGVVFAAKFPSVAVDLVEIRRKRATFLEAVLLECRETRATPITVRCEDASKLPSGQYDGVISRAFAPPAEVMDHARRLLRPGGTLVLMLQDDAHPPLADDFEPMGQHRYRFGVGWRKAMALKKRGEAFSDSATSPR